MNKHIASFLALFLLPALSIAATYEFEKNWTPLIDRAGDATDLCSNQAVEGQRGRAGFMNRIYYKFDTFMNTFEFHVLFEPCQGKLPNGFFLVVNDGPNPKKHPGELAILYVDARDQGNPLLTVYGYNGNSSTNSFRDGDWMTPGNQPADRILSNHPLADDNFITSFTVADSTRTNSDNSITNLREYKLIMNADAIVNHIPLYPEPNTDWKGILMGNMAGIWFHPVTDLIANYCQTNDAHSYCQADQAQSSAGYLKTYGFSRIGSYDTNNQETNAFPICTSSFQGQTTFDKRRGCYLVDFDDTFEANIIVRDTDDDNITVAGIAGAPSDAIVNDQLFTGVADPYLEATFEWTPDINDASKRFNVDYTFTDQSGATTSCPFSICVPRDQVPTCDIQVTSDNPNQCQGAETKINFDASSSTDPEGAQLSYTWSVDCAIDRTYFANIGSDEFNDLLSNTSGAQTTLILTGPGMGDMEDCTVYLSVSDGTSNARTCKQDVLVEPCDIDCLGNPNGDAVIDPCGVCDGDGKSCLDCAGIVNGDAKEDLCGVCNGTNDCLDCSGVPNGDSIIDICSECVPPTEVAGLSCLDCGETDITDIQFKIDGGAKALEGFINQLLNKFQTKRKRKLANYVATTKERINELQIRNWVISWLFPNIIVECAENALCVTVSNVDLIEEYKVNNLELLETGYDVAKRFFNKKRRRMKRRGASRKKLRRQRRAKKRYEQLFLTQYEENERFLALVPKSFSQCDFE